MKTKNQIKKQLYNCHNSKDINYDYQKGYINALNWVLEEE